MGQKPATDNTALLPGRGTLATILATPARDETVLRVVDRNTDRATATVVVGPLPATGEIVDVGWAVENRWTTIRCTAIVASDGWVVFQTLAADTHPDRRHVRTEAFLPVHTTWFVDSTMIHARGRTFEVSGGGWSGIVRPTPPIDTEVITHLAICARWIASIGRVTWSGAGRVGVRFDEIAADEREVMMRSVLAP